MQAVTITQNSLLAVEQEWGWGGWGTTRPPVPTPLTCKRETYSTAWYVIADCNISLKVQFSAHLGVPPSQSD